MERFDKIERLRSLRTMLMAAGQAAEKSARANLAEIAAEAAALGINTNQIGQAIDVLTASFSEAEKKAVAASLHLISDHLRGGGGTRLLF